MKKLFLEGFSSFLAQKTYSNVNTIVRFLENGYGAKCYITGGAVRDFVAGRRVSDVDIECYGLEPDMFDEAMRELGACGVGRSFFVYKMHDIDISLPRTEKKISEGHKGFEVAVASDRKEASRRRDFTINALMYDMRTGEVLDFWGGLDDLKRGLIRAVDPVSFPEDSLRVLRAARFSASFGYKIDRDTCEICRRIDLDDLPKERIFGEFEKIFLSLNHSRGFYALCTLGIMGKLFGISVEPAVLVKIARDMSGYMTLHGTRMYRYYFLAVLRQYLDIDIGYVLERLGAPKIYYRCLSSVPLVPPRPDKAFVAENAFNAPIKESVLSYHPEIRRIARETGVWDKKFDAGVSPAELIEQGFSGKELGDELERLRRERVETL